MLKLNSLEKSNVPNQYPNSSLWNTIKHNIEKKFTVDFAFKFKKNTKKGRIVQLQEDSQGKKLYMISFII